MSRERFVRWQSQSISQLSFSINLLLGLAVAALGFGVALLRDNTFAPGGIDKWLFIYSVIALACGVLFGVGATVTRLIDFRATAGKIREEEKGGQSGVVSRFEKQARVYGSATWRLFWFLTFSFASGVICLAYTVFAVYGGRLV
ncbi:MAG: hypothetical protein A3F74_05735 [Betaproteobacteria bacterium RIFCSPLOWO2_12_FULL_62_58]|nr:MAG: hypothetical protein A3F74_05735 [Betaproteobacteria bacterium RIFCSPLOWO2_12_FULL_62_58]